MINYLVMHIHICITWFQQKEYGIRVYEGCFIHCVKFKNAIKYTYFTEFNNFDYISIQLHLRFKYEKQHPAHSLPWLFPLMTRS